MALLKRIEVWILLAFSLAAVWFVLRGDADSEAGRPSAGPATVPAAGKTAEWLPAEHPEAGGRLRVREARVILEDDQEIIEIELVGTSEDDQPLDLDRVQARLVAGDGSEIAPFFVPFAAAPVLPPGGESTVTLRFWQMRTEEESRPALTLRIEGESHRLTWKDGRYRPLNRAETSP